ncbi:hypothetical protein [Kineococcus terrestris]|uniref:hypothetical protein n=1 Tax=Kineococcus terrestris TaxID=2044856 RepID=UPI0034DAC245
MSSRTDDVFSVVPRRSLPVVAGAALLVTGAAALSAGAAAAVSALVGGALATAFLASTYLLLRVLKHVDVTMHLAVALSVYLLKVSVLAGGVLALSSRSDLLGGWVAGTAAVCAVAWVVAEVRAFTRLRLPVFTLHGGDAR